MVNDFNVIGGVKLSEKRFVFYSDPGHGWLEVSRQDLKELSLEDKISGCSYQKDDKVYLEEDCDATLFVKAYEAKYGTLLFKKMNYKEVYQEDCFIRNLQHYRR